MGQDTIINSATPQGQTILPKPIPKPLPKGPRPLLRPQQVTENQESSVNLAAQPVSTVRLEASASSVPIKTHEGISPFGSSETLREPTLDPRTENKVEDQDEFLYSAGWFSISSDDRENYANSDEARRIREFVHKREANMERRQAKKNIQEMKKQELRAKARGIALEEELARGGSKWKYVKIQGRKAKFACKIGGVHLKAGWGYVRNIKSKWKHFRTDKAIENRKRLRKFVIAIQKPCAMARDRFREFVPKSTGYTYYKKTDQDGDGYIAYGNSKQRWSNVLWSLTFPIRAVVPGVGLISTPFMALDVAATAGDTADMYASEAAAREATASNFSGCEIFFAERPKEIVVPDETADSAKFLGLITEARKIPEINDAAKEAHVRGVIADRRDVRLQEGTAILGVVNAVNMAGEMPGIPVLNGVMAGMPVANICLAPVAIGMGAFDVQQGRKERKFRKNQVKRAKKKLELCRNLKEKYEREYNKKSEVIQKELNELQVDFDAVIKSLQTETKEALLTRRKELLGRREELLEEWKKLSEVRTRYLSIFGGVQKQQEQLKKVAEEEGNYALVRGIKGGLGAAIAVASVANSVAGIAVAAAPVVAAAAGVTAVSVGTAGIALGVLATIPPAFYFSMVAVKQHNRNTVEENGKGEQHAVKVIANTCTREEIERAVINKEEITVCIGQGAYVGGPDTFKGERIVKIDMAKNPHVSLLLNAFNLQDIAEDLANGRPINKKVAPTLDLLLENVDNKMSTLELKTLISTVQEMKRQGIPTLDYIQARIAPYMDTTFRANAQGQQRPLHPSDYLNVFTGAALQTTLNEKNRDRVPESKEALDVFFKECVDGVPDKGEFYKSTYEKLFANGRMDRNKFLAVMERFALEVENPTSYPDAKGKENERVKECLEFVKYVRGVVNKENRKRASPELFFFDAFAKAAWQVEAVEPFKPELKNSANGPLNSWFTVLGTMEGTDVQEFHKQVASQLFKDVDEKEFLAAMERVALRMKDSPSDPDAKSKEGNQVEVCLKFAEYVRENNARRNALNTSRRAMGDVVESDNLIDEIAVMEPKKVPLPGTTTSSFPRKGRSRPAAVRTSATK